MSSFFLIVIALILFLFLMLLAIKIGVNKGKSEAEETRSVIHTSGIYSVLRKSPREAVLELRPKDEELRKYLSKKNEDINGSSLSEEDRERLVSDFYKLLGENITEIENGDHEGCEYYYYEFDKNDTVCGKYVTRGQYVTRSHIFKYCQLIPPFHIGCGCKLLRHQSNKNLRDTAANRLQPFFAEESVIPSLPNWHTILKLFR